MKLFLTNFYRVTNLMYTICIQKNTQQPKDIGGDKQYKVQIYSSKRKRTNKVIKTLSLSEFLYKLLGKKKKAKSEPRFQLINYGYESVFLALLNDIFVVSCKYLSFFTFKAPPVFFSFFVKFYMIFIVYLFFFLLLHTIVII